MDIDARDKWEEYSKAKDATFAHTNILKLPGSLWKQMKKTGSPHH